MLRPLSFILVVAGCLPFIGCTPGDCESNKDCKSGEYCFVGSCIPRQPTGNGGSGGQDPGGSGGGAGDGGSGGEGERPQATSITVEFFADSALSRLLAGNPRDVVEIRVQAIAKGTTSEGSAQIEDRLRWKSASPPPDRMFRIDVPPIEILLDEPVFTDDPVEIAVEVVAPDIGGDRHLFASARSLGTAQANPNLVLLSLEPAFDYDGDGMPDLNDCAPSVPISQGEPGLCDGEDSSCTPDVCHIKTHAEFREIRDIACHDSSCYVSAIGSPPGLQVFDASLAEAGYEFIETVMEIERMSIVSGPEGDSLVVRDENELSHRVLGGAVDDWEYLLFAQQPTSNFARGINFLYLAGDAFLATLDPTQDPWDACGVGTCNPIMLGAYGDSAKEIAVHPISTTVSDVYVRFTRDRRLAVLHVSERNIEQAQSELLNVLPQEFPRSIDWGRDHRHLYVVGGVEQGFGEAAIVSADRTVSPFPLPPGVCPSLVRVVGDHLLIADDCQSSLWELPLRASGMPDHGKARQIHLPGCSKPSVLGAQATTTDPILVGCSDREDRFFVVGRD